MKTKTITLITSLVFVSVALGFQDNASMGTWKLNEAKSKFAGKARNNTVVYEAAGDQIKVTVDGVDESGGAVHHEWTGKFDGKEYPVTGDPNSDARSYRMVDKRALEIKAMKGGKQTLTGRIVVSADGKSRTVTTTSTDAQGKKVTNVAVYDKQ
jgi:endonuclease YncB( thermonuclease family)